MRDTPTVRDESAVPSLSVAGLLAHQGGWDEILLVIGPILLIAGLLRLAKHRVTRGGDTIATSSDGDRGRTPAPSSDGTTSADRPD